MDKRWPKVVEQGLRQLSEEEPDNFQFERSMARVQQSAKLRRTRLMRTTKTLIPIGVVAVLVAALLLIPATYTVTVGSLVTLTIPGASHTIAQELGPATRDLPGVEKANMMMTPDGLTLNFASSDTDPEKIRKTVLAAVNGPLSGVDYELNAVPVTVERGGNALAALTGGVIHINTEGLSDAQIEAAIADAILGQGMTPTVVDVQTSPDGSERDIRIEMEGDMEPGEERNFEFHFDGEEPEGEIHREIVTEDE